MQVSFRFVMSFMGFLFVAATGFFSFFITWHLSTGVIDDVSSKLREEVVATMSKEVIDVTSGVREQSLRGAIGPLGTSDFGCCSVTSDQAKYVGDFEEVRRYHWENLLTNPNLLLSFSGTMAGSLLLVSTSGDMRDIDGSEARQGRGNLQWTLSDASTNYTYHQYYSNSYARGQFSLAQTSLCGAAFVPGSLPDTASALASQDECDEAARELVGPTSSSIVQADAAAPHGCQLEPQTGRVLWNPGNAASPEAMEYRALCKTGYWFRRDERFQPSCSHEYPCSEGEFVPVSDAGFDPSLFVKKSPPYNATQRSWWKGAVANGAACRGAYCPGRSQPGWSKVYLSKSTGQLVLPSVFPLYVGSTSTVRAVITLGIGLQYLDQFISSLVQKVSPDARGWIVDLSSDLTRTGTLLASFPEGLSTADHDLVLATRASAAGAGGDYVEAVSKEVRDSSPEGWLGILEPVNLEYKNDLIQAHRISDGHGLEWLFILSVPNKVFWGDLVLARRWVLVGVCALTASMCAVLFVLSCLVSNSLMKLGTRMAEVADMKMESMSCQRISMYTEVSSMEQSFKAMTKRLSAFWMDEQARNRKREETHRRRVRARVLSAISETETLRHPMVLCNARCFVDIGSLRSYEMLRDAGKLHVLDTMDKVTDFASAHAIVFISHQWLDWGQPDPDNVHHRAMVSAILQLQKTMQNPAEGNGPLRLEDMYIWVDYSSISQEHRGMQMLAISSLPVYSSIAHAFVIVAPTTTHKQTCEVCDLGSYDARGWCRLETLSKVCTSGIHNMYLMDSVDEPLVPVTMEMFKQRLSLQVFEGNFSCCAMGHKNQAYCDKEQLVQSVLGLYFKTLLMQGDPSCKVVLEHIEGSKGRFFPSFFRFSLPEGAEEERELFGDLVSCMEMHAEQTLQDQLTPILNEEEIPRMIFRMQQHCTRSSSRHSGSTLNVSSAPPMMAHRSLGLRSLGTRSAGERSATIKTPPKTPPRTPRTPKEEV